MAAIVILRDPGPNNVYLGDVVTPSGIVSEENFGTLDFELLPLPVFMFPRNDVFLGGKTVVIHGEPKLVDTNLDVVFSGQTLPSSVTPELLGTGSIKADLSSQSGVLLATNNTSGSIARLTTNASYQSVDLGLTARIIKPTSTLPSSGLVECLVFKFKIDDDNYAQIKLTNSNAMGAKTINADSFISLVDEAYVGGTLSFSSAQIFELHVIRHQNYLGLTVNGRLLAMTSRFSASAPFDPGVVIVEVNNLSVAANVATRVQALTVRSHALIGGQLLANKTDFSTRRIIGEVPPTPRTVSGSRDIILFGPWGAQTYTNGFLYT